MRRLAFALIAGLVSYPASAWWDEGHMQIAYLAYKRLDPAVKDKVDALLTLNPDYAQWTAGIADPATAKLHAFVHAATWADDIKLPARGYDDDKPTDATAGQNIGYIDHNRHAFWHYKDIAFSPDGAPLPAPPPVDLVTQLKLMLATLPKGASDDIRSYDLVWTIHLVGDAHQPLHAVARYTRELPGGDAGGNAEPVIPAAGDALPLHLYWDRVFGGYASVFGAMTDADAKDGLANVPVDKKAAAVLDPEVWIEESAVLAQDYAYAPPLGPGPYPVMLPRDYETNARNIARARAALAAARLANVLNTALK